MEQFFKILLFIHVGGGFISLLLGSYIMVVKKGDKIHKLLGNLFFMAMLSAAIVSLLMAYLHPNYFLFIIGVFTNYMLISGKRYLKIKKVDDISFKDWALVTTMLVFGILFVGFGVLNLSKGINIGIVFLVFGAVSLRFVYQDYQNFKGFSKVKNFGLLSHIQRMIGAYIASFTAFLVVNSKYFSGLVPSFVPWLVPTIVLVPLIIKWSRKYEVLKK